MTPPDADGDCMFEQVYRGVSGSAMVTPQNDSAGALEVPRSYIGFAFRSVVPSPYWEQERSIDGLVRLLEPLGLEDDFDCQLSYWYSGRRRVRPVVALPARLPESAALPFDSIEGVRVVKREGKKIRYSAVIDLDPPRGFVVNLQFGLRAVLNSAVAEKVIELGNRYVSLLVREGDQNGEQATAS